MSFKKGNHGLSKNKELVSIEILKWFDKYLKNEQIFKEEKIRQILD